MASSRSEWWREGTEEAASMRCQHERCTSGQRASRDSASKTPTVLQSAAAIGALNRSQQNKHRHAARQ